jgi:four helix bundle protein
MKFSSDIIKLYKFFVNYKKEFIISKQLLRSGTSIGANIIEGLHGESRKDFLHKMNIALKEAAESEYWIMILNENNYLDDYSAHKSLLNDCIELNKILRKIVKTTKENLSN